jgi:sRNA-binding carbon storage regulator CsrA
VVLLKMKGTGPNATARIGVDARKEARILRGEIVPHEQVPTESIRASADREGDAA